MERKSQTAKERESMTKLLRDVAFKGTRGKGRGGLEKMGRQKAPHKPLQGGKRDGTRLTGPQGKKKISTDMADPYQQQRYKIEKKGPRDADLKKRTAGIVKWERKHIRKNHYRGEILTGPTPRGGVGGGKKKKNPPTADKGDSAEVSVLLLDGQSG